MGIIWFEVLKKTTYCAWIFSRFYPSPAQIFTLHFRGKMKLFYVVAKFSPLLGKFVYLEFNALHLADLNRNIILKVFCLGLHISQIRSAYTCTVWLLIFWFVSLLKYYSKTYTDGLKLRHMFSVTRVVSTQLQTGYEARTSSTIPGHSEWLFLENLPNYMKLLHALYLS